MAGSMSETFHTPSGAKMTITVRRTKTLVVLDFGKHHASPRHTALIERVAAQAIRRYRNHHPHAVGRHEGSDVSVSRWLIECRREDADEVTQALYDTDGGLYVTAEEFLRRPSDPREERAA